MFTESVGCLCFLKELHEGVAGGPAVGFLHEENPVFSIIHVAGMFALAEKIYL